MLENIITPRKILGMFKGFFSNVLAAALFMFFFAVVVVQCMVVTNVCYDNEVVQVRSFLADEEKIIEKSGFTVEEDNKVITEYFDPSQRGSLIIITNPHDVLIYEDDKLLKVVTVSGTVGDALEKAKIELRDGDKLSISKKVAVTESMKVTIHRAFKLTIVCDGKKTKINTTDITVARALSKAGIAISDEDIVSPSLGKELTKKSTITVKRVTYKETKKTVSTDYDTVVEYDDSLYEEKVYVKTEGKKGKQVEYYKEKYIDGKYDSAELVKVKVKKDPVTKVVVRGSKPSLYGGGVASRVISDLTPPYRIDLDENDRPIKYVKKITGEATAYSTGTVCSTGMRAQEGVVAVDPREIPYGTKMYIVSRDNRYVYGYCIAGDTGGFIYNSETVVDLYIGSASACKQFGRRIVDIYILE